LNEPSHWIGPISISLSDSAASCHLSLSLQLVTYVHHNNFSIGKHPLFFAARSNTPWSYGVDLTECEQSCTASSNKYFPQAQSPSLLLGKGLSLVMILQPSCSFLIETHTFTSLIYLPWPRLGLDPQGFFGFYGN
jgi:hypothetical protein